MFLLRCQNFDVLKSIFAKTKKFRFKRPQSWLQWNKTEITPPLPRVDDELALSPKRANFFRYWNGGRGALNFLFNRARFKHKKPTSRCSATSLFICLVPPCRITLTLTEYHWDNWWYLSSITVYCHWRRIWAVSEHDICVVKSVTSHEVML